MIDKGDLMHVPANLGKDAPANVQEVGKGTLINQVIHRAYADVLSHGFLVTRVRDNPGYPETMQNHGLVMQVKGKPLTVDLRISSGGPEELRREALEFDFNEPSLRDQLSGERRWAAIYKHRFIAKNKEEEKPEITEQQSANISKTTKHDDEKKTVTSDEMPDDEAVQFLKDILAGSVDKKATEEYYKKFEEQIRTSRKKDTIEWNVGTSQVMPALSI